MNSDVTIMNYTFQSHHSQFYLICFYLFYPQTLKGFPLYFSNCHGIFLNKGGMLFVK